MQKERKIMLENWVNVWFDSNGLFFFVEKENKI